MLKISKKKGALQDLSLNNTHIFNITVFATATTIVIEIQTSKMSQNLNQAKKPFAYLPFLLKLSLLYNNYPTFKVTLLCDFLYPLYDTGGTNQPSGFKITVTFSMLGQKITGFPMKNVTLLRFCSWKILTLICCTLNFMFFQVIILI